MCGCTHLIHTIFQNLLANLILVNWLNDFGVYQREFVNTSHTGLGLKSVLLHQSVHVTALPAARWRQHVHECARQICTENAMGTCLCSHLLLCCCAEAGITVARVAVALLFFLCLTCSHASSLTAAGHCYRGRFLVASSIPTLASG